MSPLIEWPNSAKSLQNLNIQQINKTLKMKVIAYIQRFYAEEKKIVMHIPFGLSTLRKHIQ